ncbi:helix-turn-helix transcriptional regulator [Streptomyces sp. NPDC012794]|uniref:helix-turn-helix transcriptional regulator n=1 Tax=Streptomyces sp. NPDC012794 TaxID=3364850 RepID=UPI0036AEB228
MAATTETPANRLTLLGALVRQRRVELGLTQQQGAKTCGLSNQTYWNVESGVQVRDTTYAKVERGFTMRAGSCRAVIQGADFITLTDGTELIAGAQIQRPSLERQAEDVRAAVNTAARLVVPGITLGQADAMTEKVLEELQKRGILPTAS